ncbi:hypothetical protein [Streptosporangium sp. NPDC049644]
MRITACSMPISSASWSAADDNSKAAMLPRPNTFRAAMTMRSYSK